MTKTQFNNLIQFNLIFNGDVIRESPDYIEEKWIKFIGIPLNNVTTSPSEFTLEWQEKWKADSTILPVVEILPGYRTFLKDTPSDMLDRFGRVFDKEQINVEPAHGLHHALIPVVDIWIKHNLRDYNLCLLT